MHASKQITEQRNQPGLTNQTNEFAVRRLDLRSSLSTAEGRQRRDDEDGDGCPRQGVWQGGRRDSLAGEDAHGAAEADGRGGGGWR